jgi:hypothetical protein
MAETKERVSLAKISTGTTIPPYRPGDEEMTVKEIRDKAIKKIYGDKIKKKPGKKTSDKKE